jgi:arginine decarboxylase
MKKLKIFLTKGKGKGITEESAYCEALNKAGLINLNLITLSSVLPHNCEIINKKPKFSYQDYGKRVYVIMSELRTSKIGQTICVGLGWMREKGNSGSGIVIEIQGSSEKGVRRDIKNSLSEITKYRKEKFRSKINITTETIKCKNKAVCALTALTFGKAHSWTE